MPEPIRVQVNIDKKNYHLVSTEPEEYLHKVARMVNQKVEEIEQRNQFISSDVKMVLTALNLAEDVVRAREESALLQKKVREFQAQIEELKTEVACLQEEIQQNTQKQQGGKTTGGRA